MAASSYSFCYVLAYLVSTLNRRHVNIPASLWAVFHQFDSASIDFSIVQLIQGILHVRVSCKFNDSAHRQKIRQLMP